MTLQNVDVPPLRSGETEVAPSDALETAAQIRKVLNGYPYGEGNQWPLDLLTNAAGALEGSARSNADAHGALCDANERILKLEAALTALSRSDGFAYLTLFEEKEARREFAKKALKEVGGVAP